MPTSSATKIFPATSCESFARCEIGRLGARHRPPAHDARCVRKEGAAPRAAAPRAGRRRRADGPTQRRRRGVALFAADGQCERAGADRSGTRRDLRHHDRSGRRYSAEPRSSGQRARRRNDRRAASAGRRRESPAGRATGQASRSGRARDVCRSADRGEAEAGGPHREAGGEEARTPRVSPGEAPRDQKPAPMSKPVQKPDAVPAVPPVPAGAAVSDARSMRFAGCRDRGVRVSPRRASSCRSSTPWRRRRWSSRRCRPRRRSSSTGHRRWPSWAGRRSRSTSTAAKTWPRRSMHRRSPKSSSRRAPSNTARSNASSCAPCRRFRALRSRACLRRPAA